MKSKSNKRSHEESSNNEHRSNNNNNDHEDSVLSIEDTNRLRAKLGLKPLEVNDGNEDKKSKKSKSSENDKDDKQNASSEKTKEVFIKTENISERKKLELTREKLNAFKEKRKITEKLRSIKTLGEEDDEEEDAISWVEKNRRLQEEKLKAQEKARMLEEMDEQLGIVALIEEEKLKKKANLYSEKNLSGLKVGHSKDFFKEGSQVILTLQDKDVLDEKDDVLINVNMIDDEKAAKNNENKLKKPTYQPYDEPEFDELGILKKRNLLSKYDEEIEGMKKESFTLGNSDAEREKELAMIKEKLNQTKGIISLELPEYKVASEYYTEEEMTKFKKPKKKIRKVRKTKLDLDELPIQSTSEDFGSRNKRGDKITEDVEIKPGTSKSTLPLTESIHNNGENDYDFSNVVIEEDEAELELQRTLEKARKLKAKEINNEAKNIEKLISNVVSIKTEPMDNDNNEDFNESEAFYIQNSKDPNLIINSTAEFCRNLGEIPSWHVDEDEDDELLDFEKEIDDNKKKVKETLSEEKDSKSNWNEVDMDAEKSNDSITDAPILEEEPDVSLGVANALRLATKKGYLDRETKKPSSAPRHHLQAKNYTIEEKFYEDDKQGRRERYNGPVMKFREKDTYKPDVKLEYVDSNGRLLNQKEAFRILSHKFHGKGPGKGKIDKRMKKLEQESKLRQMNSTDTPLGTLKLLQDKQKELHSPYVLLSGPATLTKK